MVKYIITWLVLSMQTAPCPDANKASEFGITNVYVSCAVHHTRTVKINKERIFYSKDSANVFLKRLKDYKSTEISFYRVDKIRDIKLDSVAE